MTARTEQQHVPELRFPGFKGEWEVSTISEQLKKVIDYRGKAPPKADSGVPLITARNVREGYLDFTADEYIEEDQYDMWMRRGIPQADDVLFTTEAPLGNVALYPSSGRYALGQRIITLQADSSRCHSVFLFHLLRSETAQKAIDAKGTGSTAKGIKSKVFVQIPLSYPTLPEQRKIAEFLTDVDGRIGQLSQKKALLEDYKKGVMQQLFTQALRFKDDHGNDFPEWEEKTLGEVCELVSGLTYTPENVAPDGLLVLRSSNVQNGQIVFDDNVFVKVEVNEWNMSRPDDILICVRNGSKNLIGKNAIIPEGGPSSTHGAFMTVLRGGQNRFVFQLLQTDTYKRYVHINLGATINSINGSDLKKFKFGFPSIPEQTKIANFLTALDRKIESVSSQISHTQTFKKGLLQQMFV
ncbi:MAG: restriction endonuclease subunit S [Akkermansiaceae bacterium]|nr:restriction endonuclease subunit S [Akkermansiaceae bacterium]